MTVETEPVSPVLKAAAVVGCSQPAEAATENAPHPQTRILVPVLLTATLLWASYFPLNFGWLGWTAMVPFLVLVRATARPRRLYLGAFFAGLIFFVASVQWMRVADDRMYATWIGLSIACALFFPVALFFLRRLDQRMPLPLTITFPIVWTALEYLRAHLFTGFPWYFLSHTQHDFLPIIQISDVTGAYGVTFLLAAASALIFEIAYSRPAVRTATGCGRSVGPRRAISLPVQTTATMLVIALTVGYGLWRLGQNSAAPGPLVGLIQGNLEQAVRNGATDNVEDAVAKVEQHYFDLTRQAIDQPVPPNLLVWPETSYAWEWLETAPEVPPDQVPWRWAVEVDRRHDELTQRVRDWHADILIGANTSVLVKPRQDVRYNSALFAKANGKLAGRYNKMHCVPFGEYVPLKDWFPFMNKLAPYDFDYSIHAGEQFTRFAHGLYHFGVLICYEDTDPYLARQYLRPDTGGPPVDFLVNISNDGWFQGTSEHEQHLAICRFRAVECRRAVARAVNMGISAVIDGNGRIVALPAATWAKSKKIATVLTASIPIDDRLSFYAAWGDWLPLGCWIGIALGMIWTLSRQGRHAGEGQDILR
jgi:apolipoprotein N-acyltransferase